MRSFEEDTPFSLASRMTMGISRATTAVLLITIDRGAAASITARSCRTSPLPATDDTIRESRWMMPVRSTAPLRMNMASTVMAAGLLNPEMTSCGFKPRTGARIRSVARIAKATKSTG